MKRIASLCALMMSGPVAAQDAAPKVAPFAGPYAGVEAGLHEHGFDLKFYDGEGSTDRRSYDRTGIGAGLFAGYDWAVSRRMRLGAELTGNVGGGDGGRAALPGGGTFELRPRWGVNAVGRAGYVVGDRALLYGSLGYGGYRYRLRTSRYVENAREWNDGVVFGGGVEYRLSRRIGVRLDARRLGGQATQLLLGAPIRF